MRIGIMVGADGKRSTLAAVIGAVQRAEAAGFDDVWMANIFALDAIATLALAGRATRHIGLGTAVTPTYPRHPTAMAQQALTAAAAADNRFVLGIGLSHRLVIEDMFGMSFAKPARHMREYLKVLLPLLRGDVVTYHGEEYRVTNVQLDVPGVEDVPVVLAALGPAMLRLAGELTAGTSTWMVGPKTMEGHIVKHMHAAASAAGRPTPRIIGGFPIVLTRNVDQARAKIAKGLAIYGELPSYRDMLDREGLAGPADLAIIGDETTLRAALTRLAAAGVTDFNASIMGIEEGAYDRTFEFLAAWRMERS